MGKAHIGCSGYLYNHWRDGVFYPQNLPQKEEFSYYSSVFSTVELNSTFYRLPPKKVWQSWEERAPDNFIYSVKMNRFLTHIKRLNDPKDPWKKFWEGASELKNHLGPILFQLPPNLAKDKGKLLGLSKILPKNLYFSFEFRHTSWFDDEIYEFLQKNNWALTVVSHPSLPFIPKTTASFGYLRFHGEKSLYGSSYSQERLKYFAKLINGWLKKNLDVYAYFNNDFAGFAPKNALYLNQLLAFGADRR